MTRAETIDLMIKKAIAITGKNSKNYTWEKGKELWEMAYDWNANHAEDEEIFMCEIYKEDGYDADGFMIEDDYFLWED